MQQVEGASVARDPAPVWPAHVVDDVNTWISSRRLPSPVNRLTSSQGVLITTVSDNIGDDLRCMYHVSDVTATLVEGDNSQMFAFGTLALPLSVDRFSLV
jgi:hypothetical protein